MRPLSPVARGSARVRLPVDSVCPIARKPWKRHPSPGYDVAADPTIDEKFDRVRDKLMPRGPGSDFWATGAVLADVRRDGDSALFIFDWPDEPLPLALRIDLQDTSEEFYYEDAVTSFDEWVAELHVYVMVSIGTGVAHRAKRVDRGDYIELLGS